MEALSALLAKLTLGKALGVVLLRCEQFASIAFVLIPLERLIPFHAKQRLFRAQFGIDLLHYFVGGVFIICFVAATYYAMPVLLRLVHVDFSPVSVKGLPVWVQLVLFEAGWTFLGYWLHRFEHVCPPLWRLHSIHESTRELDWLSAFRVHPLEPVLFHVLTVVPLWALGMSLPVAIGYKIYSYVFAHVQHSNVVFPIGPLKYVFPTPQFHRWHHARVYDASGRAVRSFCNFSEYPIWDLLFGTFYLPKHNPTTYGNATNVPADYLAQLAFPFNGHEKVLAWKQNVARRFRPSTLPARVRTAIAPVHDAFEVRIAQLCVLPSAAAAPASAAEHPYPQETPR